MFLLKSQKTVAYSCRNHIQAPFVYLTTRLAGLRFKNQTGSERSPLRTLHVPSISDSDGLWSSFISISTYSTSHSSSSVQVSNKDRSPIKAGEKKIFLNILKNISNSVKKRKTLKPPLVLTILCLHHTLWTDTRKKGQVWVFTFKLILITKNLILLLQSQAPFIRHIQGWTLYYKFHWMDVDCFSIQKIQKTTVIATLNKDLYEKSALTF